VHACVRAWPPSWSTVWPLAIPFESMAAERGQSRYRGELYRPRSGFCTQSGQHFDRVCIFWDGVCARGTRAATVWNANTRACRGRAHTSVRTIRNSVGRKVTYLVYYVWYTGYVLEYSCLVTYPVASLNLVLKLLDCVY
jgi:hypothetical protein